MGHDNVTKATIHQAASTPELVNTENLAPVALASSLPQGALYAKEFQPLYASLNSAQAYPYSPEPSPFAKPPAYATLVQNPAQLVSTLQPAAGNFAEDKLVDMTASLQDRLDNLIASMPESPSLKEFQTFQNQMNQIVQMMNMISNILKKLDDAKSNIVGNIK
jgi:hypothetical protein